MTQASSDRSPSRSPSPSPSGLSSTPASLADSDTPQPPHGIDLTSLRRRVRAASFSSTSNSPPSPKAAKDDTMFNRNRYQQLPTNTNGQRRRAGGLTAWKRYALLAVAGAFVVLTAFTLFGPSSRDDSIAYEETRECAS